MIGINIGRLLIQVARTDEPVADHFFTLKFLNRADLGMYFFVRQSDQHLNALFFHEGFPFEVGLFIETSF